MASPQIDLTTLSAPQLTQLKKQLDDELQHLTTSFQSLRTAQSKFKDCLKSIAEGITAKSNSKPLLVPLTPSLYVPGRLSPTTPSSRPLLVDVGTGFYVSKTADEATLFYESKIADLSGSLKELEKILNVKSANLRVVEEVLRGKIVGRGEREG
ncbi:Prefoldin alpha-like protein [Patellaria atrata CBS 101060]|uniref:Prefoldin alpha-like protein n=1 Tax=Patellaria atrata CBS 101060 TaxID=1346257 RepID=A0A9P4VQN7_9PEZI|nr:Prefoldin alpha-like protein [Patellaria atrata CBS 101060]